MDGVCTADSALVATQLCSTYQVSGACVKILQSIA